MGRIRLTQIFPCLLPLRKKQKIFCYYIGMRLDHNRYSETRSDTMLANPLFYADWPLYNYETGYTLSDGKLQLLPGGGLCQMSSFLYWLFMHTPLTVTEQHTHGIFKSRFLLTNII